jgi:hypothetical protein
MESPVVIATSINQQAVEPGGDIRHSHHTDWINQLILHLQADIAQGQYRKEGFRNLKSMLDYESGLINAYSVEVSVGEGSIKASGKGDLRYPDRMMFSIEPNVSNVPLESLSRLAGLEETLLHGPVTIDGVISAHAGNEKELLKSLTGNIDARVGPGRIRSKTALGDSLFNLLSFLHIEGLLTGEARDDYAEGGMPYHSLNVRTRLRDGSIVIAQLKLATPALNLHGEGSLDLVKQDMEMMTSLNVLKSIDAVLGHMPLVGMAVEDVTGVKVDLQGPMRKPTMTVRPPGDVVEGMKDVMEDIEAPFKK